MYSRKYKRMKQGLALILAVLLTCPGNVMAFTEVQAAEVSEQITQVGEETTPTPEETPGEPSGEVPVEPAEETPEEAPADPVETARGQIAALPLDMTMEQWQAMTEEEQAALYEKLQAASDAYDALDEAGKAALGDEYARLGAVFEIVNSDVKTMSAGHTCATGAGADHEFTIALTQAQINTNKKLTTGSYYLKEDLTLTEPLSIESGEVVHLCLNGKTITGANYKSVFYIDYGEPDGQLYLYDCQNSGELTHEKGAEANGVNNYGTFIMEGGKIASNDGGGVYNSGNFTMKAGEISGNSMPNNDGGGVYNSGNFTMENGSITGNSVTGGGYGAGVYNNGTFTMQGGEISGNNGQSQGGGIYNDSDKTCSITGGSIHNNTVSNNKDAGDGGGIYNLGTVTMQDGEIRENNALSSGGGIYNSGGGTCSITGGSIQSNTASQGGGINNRNLLTLNGATITGNTATSYGGGVYNDKTINMGGKNNVTGNTVGDSASNISMESATSMITITGALDAASTVGVREYEAPKTDKPVKFADGAWAYQITENDAATFTSDRGSEVKREGNTLQMTVKGPVVKEDPVAADFDYTAPADLIFDNWTTRKATVTAKSTVTGMGTITVHHYDENNKVVTSPKDIGTYTVKIDVAEGTSYNAITGLEVGSFTIVYLPTDEVATLDGTQGEDGWYTSNPVNIKAPDGWNISSIVDAWGPVYTWTKEGKKSVTYHLRDDKRHITDEKTINVNIDSVAPSITKVEAVPAAITVTASDATSGIAKYELTVNGTNTTQAVTAGICTFDVKNLPTGADYPYTVKVTDQAGNTSTKTGTLTKTLKTLTKDDFICTLPEDLIYTATEKNITVALTSGVSGVGNARFNFEKDGKGENPIEPGTYKVLVTAAEGTKYAAISNLEVAEFTITYQTTDKTATLEATNKGNAGWYKGNATLKAPSDWKISLDNKTWDNTAVWSTEGDDQTVTYYLKDAKGHITAGKTVALKLDKTAPVISKTTVKTTKTTADITIAASDVAENITTSGIAGYSLTLGTQSATQDTTDASYTFQVTGLTAATEYTCQVKVWDAAGNTETKDVTFTTDKIAITSVSPVLTAPVKNKVPDTTATPEQGAHYTASGVSWSTNPAKFQAGTAYTATVTLTPEKGYEFAAVISAAIAGSTVTETRNQDGTLTLKAAYPATAGRELSSIKVKTAPTKTNYTYGDSFAPDGLVLTHVYDDDTTEDVAYSQENQGDFTFAPTTLTATDKKITVTHSGKTTDIAITVAKKVVTEPTIDAADYNGKLQKATVAPSTLYTVQKNEGGTDAGSYDVVLALTDSTNYTWSGSNAATKTLTFKINPVDQANLTITNQPTAVTYGQEAFTLGTTGGSGNGAVSWSTTGAATVDNTGKVTITGAGEATITATKAADKNHTEAVSDTWTFTVAKKKLTVKAKDYTVTYGDKPAGDGVTYDGFATGDDEKKLGGTLDYEYTYQQYGDVGDTYTITPKGLTSDNYDISYKTGTLQVEQLEAAFTWKNTAARAYDGAASQVSAEVSNLQNNDEVAVTVTGGTEINAGTYMATIIGLTGTKAGNYKLPETNPTQSYTIVQSASEITEIKANEESYVYGDTITVTANIKVKAAEEEKPGFFAMLADLLAPAKDQVALYLGEKQISKAVTVGKEGSCSLTYETKEKKLPVGKSILTLKYVGNDNMAAASTTVEVTVTAKAVTAKTTNTTAITKVYDGTDTAAVTLAVDTEDLVQAADQVTVTAPASYDDKNVGTGKAITLDADKKKVSGTDASYYEVSIPTGITGTITAKPLTATVTAAGKTYDGTTAATITAAVDTGVTGESLSISGLTGTFDTKNAGNTKKVTVTSTDAVVTGAEKDNYTITYPGDAKADIARRAVTVKADKKSKVYGEKDPELTYQVENLVKDETLKGTLVRETGEEVKAEGYAINQGTVTDAGNANYTITFQKGTFLIETAEQKTLTIQDKPKSVTYGDAAFTLKAVGGSGNGAVSWSATGAAAVDNTGKVTITGAGEATITATKAADKNHTEAVSDTWTFTVAKKELTVKAKDHTITYGDNPTGDGVTYDGFVTGDDEKKLGGTLDYEYTYQQYGDVGDTYKITPKGLTSDNYDISYKTGTLQVEQLVAAFTWKNTEARAYDGTASQVTAEVSNLQNNDEVAVTVTGGAESNVGSYTATITGLTGTKAGNYKLPKVLTQKYTIVQSASEITEIKANEESYVYGDTITVTANIKAKAAEEEKPGFFAMLADLLAPAKDQVALYLGEKQISKAVTVGKEGSCSLTYETKEKKLPVGKSILTLKYVGNDNMAAASTTVEVTVTAKAVTAKTTNTTAITKVYDGTDTAAVTLAVDTEDLVQAADQVTVTAPASYDDKNVGTGKAITLDADKKKVSGTDASYYEVSIPTGITGTITAKPLTATVTAAGKTYDGTTAATITAAVDTGVTGESLSISGLTGTFDTKNAGNTKKVTVTSTDAVVTGAEKDNYTITYPGDAKADIARRAVTVKADKKSKVYGEKDPELTYQVENLVKDETLKGTLVRETGEEVKAEGYAINQGTVTDAGNANYTITFQKGTFLIETAEQKTLTIQDKPKSVTYGDAAFTLKAVGGSGNGAVSWSATGAAAVDNTGKVTITGAGEATITATKAADKNHTEAVSDTWTFTVAKKELTVKAKDHTITYGKEPAGNGVTYDGFATGDDEKKLGGSLAYECTYQQYGDIGSTYTITPKGLTSENYDISYKTGTLQVEQLEAAFTWKNTETRAYDGTASQVTAEVSNLQNNDAITVEVTGGSETEVGTYTATITGLKGEKAGNYRLPKVLAQEYKIVQSASDITKIEADKASYIYGDVVTIKASLKPVENVAEKKDLLSMLGELIAPASNQAALYQGTTQISSAVTVGADGSCTLTYDTKDKKLPMGTSTLTLRYVGNHNMADAVTTINVAIAPKPVTVRADNPTKNYGEKDPKFTYSVTGLLEQDTLSGTLIRDQGEDVKEGGYAITQGTLTDANNPNYSITYIPGTLTIAPIAQKELTITGMPSKVTYGDASFALSTTGGSGKNQVTWTADGPAAVDGTGMVTITGAGEVTITATKTADSNYTESVKTTVTMTVAQKALTWDTGDLNVTKERHWNGNADAAVSGILKVAGMVGTDNPGFTYTQVTAAYDGAEAGKHTITVTVTGASLTNGSYTLPTESITYQGEIVPVTQGANQPWQSEDSGTVYRLVLEEGISMMPRGLEQSEYNTPEKITKQMKIVLGKNPGYSETNSIVYDVELQISPDGGKTWKKATKENFPPEGLKVRMEYPKGTNASNFDFTVIHMFTEDMNGHKAGEIESPAVTKTETYIEFTVTGLSPIAVAWKPVTDSTTGNTTTGTGTTTGNTTYAAQTGDNNRIMELILLLLVSGIGMTCVPMIRRKKFRK
ncbi:MAG: MBG domain-containing protein [Lachnospiraceae bacterium]|nr:MBG domain-containing protein [Lachnospiraceae bacterium]